MNDFKSKLSQLNENLNILREREAKYAGNAPLDLLNQISDHEQAIALTEQAIAGGLSEADWREATRPLLLALQEGRVINIEIDTGGGDFVDRDQYKAARDIHINTLPQDPPLWRRLSRANLILAFIGVIAAVLAIPGVSGYVSDVFRPPPFVPAAGDETLIIIATFYETAATKTEPHTKIRRAIEEAAQKAGLNTLRVEEEPTVLKADEQQQAETLGNLYNASIIIWGEDTGVQVLVNFLNLKQPDFAAAEVKINETQRTQLANPSAYARFIVSDLPGQLTFLSFFAVGQSFYQAENYTQAKEVIEQGITSLAEGTQIKGLAEAYFGLGWLYQVPLGDLTSAIVAYTKAIGLDPKDATAYNNRGNALYTQDDLMAAIADYNKAIDLDPKFAQAYYNRGIILKAQGDLMAAIADYNKAIDLAPKDATIYNNRGNALYAQGNLTAAIADYSKAIELAPKYANAHYNRGNSLYAQSNLSAAIADYSKAIEFAPKFAQAYYSRGLALYAQGDLTAAIADYKKAIELDPNYGAAAYALQGQVEAALLPLRRSLELDRDENLALIPTDPDFDAIRDDPRFKALLAEFGVSEEK